MRHVLSSGRGRDAQTFVFFALTFGTIILLCGLAIDSGLLFLAKARMARSMDGAALAAVGNFYRSSDPATNRQAVATIMRNFAVANYTDLGYGHVHAKADFPISSTAVEQPNPYTTTTGQTAYTYTYNFNDGTKDANGAYRKFVEVVVTTGTGGQITTATCSARCPVGTYFIGAIGPFFRDLKVSASAVASRNPRLIMIVLDRSASMLEAGGGAYGLPQAVVQFLDFFDTSADYIGIVSFGSNARLEMPLTTNFLVAGTNLLFDAYQTNNNVGVPGADPEEFTTNGYPPSIPANYAYSGVRRFKFGGLTAADDGLRMGMEQLMANTGFNDPDVVKYLVLFTDGAWNQTRTLLAAPPYTNIVFGPPITATAPGSVVTNTARWSTDLASDTNIMPVPTLSPMPYATNAMAALSQVAGGDYAYLAVDHGHDKWQSYDGINEPILPNGTTPSGTIPALVGDSMTVTNYSILGTNAGNPVYARYIDVWLPPGSVDYEYTNGGATPLATYVSDMNNPTNHIQIQQLNGQYNELVVPGYVVDGLFFDEFDLEWYDNSYLGPSTYPSYKLNNFQEYFMWPDDMNSPTSSSTVTDAQNYSVCSSFERQLMFRNYANLLTGFYISRADDPAGPVGDTNNYTGAQNPSYGLGPYYPGAGFYWPFDLVGVDYYPTFCLTNAAMLDPDPQANGGNNGGSRHIAYSINMQSAAAAPEWAGEWFYKGTQGVNVISSPSNTTVSTLITSKAQWQNNAPPWLLNDFDAAGETIMTNESAHNSNVIGTASVWRPTSFSGTLIGTVSGGTTAASLVNAAGNHSSTGGYVMDSTTGNVYKDSMAWSGRPTHYFDFSQSKWMPIADNHNLDKTALPLGYWKAQEYAWHARNMGVTIFTVGYGNSVGLAQQVILAQVANATNTTAGIDGTHPNGTAISYNPSQPIGSQFYATNAADISNDFFSVGQAINAALTQ